jgi:tight adherence protein B
MILSIVIVFVAVFAVAGGAIAATSNVRSRLVEKRLALVECETVAAQPEEKATDIRREQKVGSIEWLNRWMVKLEIAPRLALLLEQADVKKSAEGIVLGSLAGAAVVAGLVFLRTGEVIPSLLFAAGSFLLPFLFLAKKRARRLAKFEQQLPEAIDMLVSALRVGHSMITGIGALGHDSPDPLGREFRKLFDEQNFGVDMRTAMTNLATRVPLQDLRIFVAAVLIQKESGGNLAEVLEKVAHTTRERFRLKKQIMVHTAQGRLTGLVLSILPVGLGLALYLINPEGMSVLWTRPLGLKLLWTAVVMIAVGCFAIGRIVRIRV